MRVEFGESLTAELAAQALAATGEPWFWLDGEAAAPGEPHVSYLGLATEVRESVRGREREFLAELRAESIAGADASPSASASATPFASGWIVALGYEFGVGLLGVDPHPDHVPPAFALRCDAVLAVDHETRTSRILGAGDAAGRLADVCRRVPEAAVGAAPSTSATPQAQWRDDAYEAHVEACREAIHRGDAYVLCLTDTAETTATATPLELYTRLRAGAMRGGVIAVPGRALVSASPERFLSVAGRTLRTHPIKGTRPRGATPAADAELARALASDPKERAENLMIVDLMRNDLSRVCERGSVTVSRFLHVETHPRVHQLVSTIEGELAAGRDVYDAIAACFPGGSMTGAPKRSAVSILGELEGGPRGLYSGCFGWISDAGDAELAMTIRGIELRGDVAAAPVRALIGAGGGITADSDPHRERAERDLKAAAMLAVLAR